MLKLGAVLRMHHMVVEGFRWRQCVTWLGVGGNSPIHTRKVEVMNWVKEDGRRVMELSKWFRERMMVNMRKVRTLERV